MSLCVLVCQAEARRSVPRPDLDVRWIACVSPGPPPPPRAAPWCKCFLWVCMCVSLCVLVCQAEARRNVPRPDLAVRWIACVSPGPPPPPRRRWIWPVVSLPSSAPWSLEPPQYYTGGSRMDLGLQHPRDVRSHLLISTSVLCPRGHTPEAKDAFQHLSPSPTPYRLKKNPKDYIIKLKNVSSNKLSFLVVKSHIFEGEAVISYLEMFSFGYELSLPVNCFYHRTSSLASSGRVLWQEAAERKSLGPGGLPRPSQLPGSSSGRSSGHRDPCQWGGGGCCSPTFREGLGPRPPHTPVSVTQPHVHRQAHAHKHHEDVDRQTATCRHHV